MQQKMESFMKTHQISVHTKNQLGWVDSLAGGGWKQPISLNFIILWPLEGQNLANVTPKRINSEN